MGVRGTVGVGTGGLSQQYKSSIFLYLKLADVPKHTFQKSTNALLVQNAATAILLLLSIKLY